MAATGLVVDCIGLVQGILPARVRIGRDLVVDVEVDIADTVLEEDIAAGYNRRILVIDLLAEAVELEIQSSSHRP